MKLLTYLSMVSAEFHWSNPGQFGRLLIYGSHLLEDGPGQVDPPRSAGYSHVKDIKAGGYNPSIKS